MEREELTALGLEGELMERVLELSSRDARAAREALEGERRDAAVERLLLRSGAREPKTVLPLLELSKVAWRDGEPGGLREQIDEVRRRAGYLFGQPEGARVDSALPHGQAPGAGGARTLGDALRAHYR